MMAKSWPDVCFAQFIPRAGDLTGGRSNCVGRRRRQNEISVEFGLGRIHRATGSTLESSRSGFPGRLLIYLANDLGF